MLFRPALHISHRAITAVLALWLCVLAAGVWAPVARAQLSHQHAVHLCSGELAPPGTPSPLAADDMGMALHHALDCPLCMPALAPPTPHHGVRLHEPAAQMPSVAVAAVHAAPSTAWPPARGPPL